MATFVKLGPCSVCGSSDALATYSDGSTYCFSHGRVVDRTDRSGYLPTEEKEHRPLPSDCRKDFPPLVTEFLKPTGITVAELIQNDYTYSSESGYRLIRLLEDGAFESRSLAGSQYGPKVHFHGSKQHANGYVLRRPGTCYVGTSQASQLDEPAWAQRGLQQLRRHGGSGASPSVHMQCTTGDVLRERSELRSDKHDGSEAQASNETGQLQLQRKALCITEDSLSAIKCGRVVDSVPLFGSSVNNDKLQRITQPYDFIYVWLDADKWPSAINISERIKLLGKDSIVIYTELDPKYMECHEYLQH